ncbi:MAG: TIGR00730 family Rossman fold protein, partial [Microbacterium sp.]|nr:TIGR00730 family Rossman fold protein [Microbacterium sp.]
AVALGQDRTDRLDLKIASAAISEMRDAFRLFQPLNGVPKATIFGSARTTTDDPLYSQAHDVAGLLSKAGWMVVTGAGPGIMQAAAEGAGRQMSIGVSIRLPFEEKANAVVAEDSHLVSMKYFFTRKLMLIKESRGFVCLPGGFGTMDEMFELLTLQQTGKAEPVPIVLLDEPGGAFWHGLKTFVDGSLAAGGYISADDLDRVLITDSVEAASREILDFWRNYDSLRWVGDQLVLRLHNDPTDAEIEALNEQFGDLLLRGRIERTEPLAPERADHDAVDLPRLVLALNQYRVGSLHRLIRAINALPSAG